MSPNETPAVRAVVKRIKELRDLQQPLREQADSFQVQIDALGVMLNAIIEAEAPRLRDSTVFEDIANARK